MWLCSVHVLPSLGLQLRIYPTGVLSRVDAKEAFGDQFEAVDKMLSAEGRGAKLPVADRAAAATEGDQGGLVEDQGEGY